MSTNSFMSKLLEVYVASLARTCVATAVARYVLCIFALCLLPCNKQMSKLPIRCPSLKGAIK